MNQALQTLNTRSENNGRPLSLSLYIVLLLLQPVLWVIGIEQPVLIIGTILVCLVGLYKKELAGSSIPIKKLLVIFVCLHFVSGFIVVVDPEPMHYLPLYIYRMLLAVSSFSAFCIIAATVKNTKEILWVSNKIVILLLVSILISLLAILFPRYGSGEISTLMSYIMPQSVLKINFLHNWFYKSIIDRTVLFGDDILRCKGLFTYPNLFAISCEIAIMMSILLGITRNKLYLVSGALFVITLIMSTSRAGIVSLACGIMVTTLAMFQKYVTMLFIILVGFIFLFAYSADLTREFVPVEVVMKIKEKILTARSDSNDARMIIYSETSKAIAERPFLGWGTYRKFPGKPDWPYLGSHSTYLSVVFRMGIVGLLTFLCILGVVFKFNYDSFVLCTNNDNVKCSAVFLGTLSIILVHMIALDIQDDVYSSHLVWVTFGLISSLYINATNGGCNE